MKRDDLPKFEKRTVVAALIFWGIALLCCSPVYIYAARHPGVPGELDLGGAGIATICLFVSGVFVLCGLLAVIHGLISFLWRRWRYVR
jgi:hypothetical protein